MGIVSWGFECGSETFPGVFARIASAHDWITEQVDSISTSSPSTVAPVSMTSLPSAFPFRVPTSAPCMTPSTSPSTSTSPTSTPTTSPIVDTLPTSTPSTSPTTNPLESSADSSALAGTKLFALSFAYFVNAVALLVLF